MASLADYAPQMSCDAVTHSDIMANNTEAFKFLLQADLKLLTYIPPKGSSSPDFTAQILSMALVHLPREGNARLIEDIIRCPSDAHLKAVADRFLACLLVPFKARKLTPTPTPPRSSLDEKVVLHPYCEVDYPDEGVHQTWARRAEGIRQACLRRDNDRCIITESHDFHQARKKGIIQETVEQLDFTEACHIIPLCFGDPLDSEYLESYTIWDTLMKYFPKLRTELNFTPPMLNHPMNIITMSTALHEPFNQLLFSLQPTSTDNLYQIKTYRGFPATRHRLLPKDKTVAIETWVPDCPLPSKYLIAVHATLAEILHGSDVMEHLGRLIPKMDELECLAEDGSTDVASMLMIKMHTL
ncbi:hypothetical protein DFH27DRAFT_233494 [Peziza echinospora]|nr:hypothetical protein DFH27DRAFT_233494 [Peziza echinospora]